MSATFEPCAGLVVGKKTARELGIPQMGGICNDRVEYRIKGDDGKWRCMRCNKIYVELIYLQMERRTQ